MARRIRSPTSQQGTPPVRTRVQSQQVKKEKIGTDKVATAKRTTREAQEDASARDDDDGVEDAGGEVDPEEDEEGDEQGEGSPRGRKRARMNEEGDDAPSRDVPDGILKERRVTLPRDTDGFIPGSIVRIQLKNFVTYDYVEFCPGPYLNMILGPNGTGKSSIACAICLGLNFPIAILGRATDLNSFVKNNTDSGYIELELKGPKGKRNIVVRRNLSAKSKGSTFTLNGQSASGREISQKMLELNVQVGNLCSFLPQDKVSEFAQMSPQQLLRETQRAAGDEHLTQWHDTLISSGKDLKHMVELMNTERDTLKTMQERNDDLERDVLRYKERKQIEHNIALLEVLLPVQQYREIRQRFMDIKSQQRALHESVTKLKEKNAPAHALLKRLEEKYNAHSHTRDQKKKATKAKFDKMKNKWESSEKIETDADELSMKLDRLKKEEKERVKRVKSLEADIAKLKSDIASHTEVKVEKEEHIMDEWKQVNLERQDVLSRQAALQDRQKHNADQVGRWRGEINMSTNELKQLDNAQNRKLLDLQRWDKDTADAVAWLRSNRDKFKMEVFEPPMLSLTVPRKEFVHAIEGLIGGSLKTFVAQCQEDYDTFNHYINDSACLGRRVRIGTWFRPANVPIPPPPLNEEEMQHLGFSGYAIDYVDCPEGLKWYLKCQLHFHRTAIGLDPKKVDVKNAMEAVSRLGPNGEGGGATFISGMTSNQVNRSKYGKRATQNMTKEFRQARNLTASTIDPEIKKRIDNKILEARRELDVLAADDAEIEEELKKVHAEDAIFTKKIDGFRERKEAIMKHNARTHTLDGKLKRAEESHQRILVTPTAEAERVRIKGQLLEMTKKRVKIAREYADLVRGVIADQVEATRVGLEFLQVGANKTALQELCNKKDEKYQAAVMEFNKVDAEFRQIKAESKEVLATSRTIVLGIDAALREDYDAIEEVRIAWEKEVAKAEEEGRTPPEPGRDVDMRTADELHAELEMQRANLDMNLNTNPGVVEQYEKRKKDIEALTRTVEEREKKANKIERAIKNARDNWQPALAKLVASIGEKFSAAFDRIGCAGEIRISEHEDYDKWAIDILVKFRDSEKLQLLTGQRQSGGERSLTTILYLMSLTEEARAPFSLVDEINQGMDARAERTVHNSMVEVTCKEDSAQYFLITPKLLADLDYHERMKVLCVNNGEWLPEEKDLGNMMNMIEAYVRHRDRGSSAA